MSAVSIETTEDYLRHVAVMHRAVPGWAHSSAEEFVLRHGTRFEMKPKPDGVRWGITGQCYANAHNEIQRHSDPYYVYVEGYAMSVHGLVVQHAWILDELDGKAFDPTWKPPRAGLCLNDYVGVVIPTDDLMRITSETGYYSVLSSHVVLREPWKPTNTGWAG